MARRRTGLANPADRHYLGPMQRITGTIAWNLALLTFGAAIYSFGIKEIVLGKGLMAGGVSGVALLLYYLTGMLGPGILYFLINLPLMALGWMSLSRGSSSIPSTAWAY